MSPDNLEKYHHLQVFIKPAPLQVQFFYKDDSNFHQKQ